MRRRGHRRMHQELRQRVAALHMSYELGLGTKSVADMTAAMFRATQCEDSPEPCTCDAAIHQEMARARKHGAPAVLLDLARAYATDIKPVQEPNVRVRAAFGAERALYDAALGLFQDLAPDLFISGVPYMVEHDPITGASGISRWCATGGSDDADTESSWTGIHPMDTPSISSLQVPWDTVAQARLYPAAWTPLAFTQAYAADPTRAPIEAMVLAASAIRGTLHYDLQALFSVLDLGRQVSVAAIGVGYAVGAQALSVMVPLAKIWNIPVAYNQAGVPTMEADAVVLGLPSRHQLAAANIAAGNRKVNLIERRKILSGQIDHLVTTTHVPDLVDLALGFRKPGTPLILVGDPACHAAAVAILNAQDLVVPLVSRCIDTSVRPVWVGYRERQWAPHGLPSPTGRVVSTWSWK